MTILLHRSSADDVESTRLAERLIRCLPAATFEMETLCSLAGIRASRAIPTAAVECGDRPRLLVNPDFVTTHCARDEHLFLLVMHELWHIILAHTRLWPRATQAENIAFDAIINAGLARQHPGPEYRGFFEAVNPADAFPGLLLRPPEGWPARPRYPRVGPSGTRRILERLYPRGNPDGAGMPLYEDILALVAPVRPEAFKAVWLLGDHADETAEWRAMDDPLFGDVIRRIVAKWPPPPFPLSGRDAGRRIGEWFTAVGSVPDPVRRCFVRVLRRALGPASHLQPHRARATVSGTVGLGVLPNTADRLAPARRRLGLSPTLWLQTGTVITRVRETPAEAHVYLDVSGSMAEVLPGLVGLLMPYVRQRRAQVFQFSTEVRPCAFKDLRRGRLSSTQGTNIDCVLEHALGTPRVRRLLVLTDGYTGPPKPALADAVRDRGLRVYVVLPAESVWRRDLEGFAHSMTVLPPLRKSGSGWGMS